MKQTGFTYTLRPARVVLRVGAIADLAAELERLGSHRALVITTPGRTEDVAGLGGNAIAGVFEGARPHVPADAVNAALDVVSHASPDALVALGGGSAIGLAKAIAMRSGLTIVAVPTTYSGSEMTRIWGVTADGRKTTGRDDRAAPRTVVYDPKLTLSLDPATSAASGMNAIAHALESLYAIDANPVSELFAGRAIELLAPALRRIAREPADLAARTDALAGSHLAARALDMTEMGLHHKLCHMLGGAFDTPHALTHAILLPHVAAFNLPAAPQADAVVRSALGSSDAAAGLASLAADIGIRSRLRDFELGRDDLARLAADWKGGVGHPRPASQQDVQAILEAAW